MCSFVGFHYPASSFVFPGAYTEIHEGPQNLASIEHLLRAPVGEFNGSWCDWVPAGAVVNVRAGETYMVTVAALRKNETSVYFTLTSTVKHKLRENAKRRLCKFNGCR